MCIGRDFSKLIVEGDFLDSDEYVYTGSCSTNTRYQNEQDVFVVVDDDVVFSLFFSFFWLHSHD